MITKNEHRLGPLHPRILIIEYADFECPYCAALAPSLKKILQDFPSEVGLLFRHFPLGNIHESARLAAQAAEAADEQGQFWKMHDLLFKNQTQLSERKILKLAKTLGLNLVIFEEALKNDEIRSYIDQNIEEGLESGVDSTPTLFISGERYTGASSYEQIRKYLLKELESGESTSSFL